MKGKASWPQLSGREACERDPDSPHTGSAPTETSRDYKISSPLYCTRAAASRSNDSALASPDCHVPATLSHIIQCLPGHKAGPQATQEDSLYLRAMSPACVWPLCVFHVDPLSEGPAFLSNYCEPHAHSFILTACQPSPGRSPKDQPGPSLQLSTSGNMVCQAFTRGCDLSQGEQHWGSFRPGRTRKPTFFRGPQAIHPLSLSLSIYRIRILRAKATGKCGLQSPTQIILKTESSHGNINNIKTTTRFANTHHCAV